MIYQLGDQIPQLGEDVYIAPSADVIGSVSLGARSSVWFGDQNEHQPLTGLSLTPAIVPLFLNLCLLLFFLCCFPQMPPCKVV